MNVPALKIDQSQEEKKKLDSSDFPVSFITDPKSLLSLTGKQLLTFFRKPEEESHVEIPEVTSQQTTGIGEFSPPIIQLPAKTKRVNNMISLQKWQGYVLDILDGCLLVRLINLTRKGPDEEAEIPIDEISEDDKDLIRPGAVFYWNIGYFDSYTRQRTRISLIRFQRLPAWSDEEIDAARQEAKRIQDIIAWE
jgi:hypothetical protein